MIYQTFTFISFGRPCNYHTKPKTVIWHQWKNGICRGGSTTAATSKMELFVITVNSWKLLTIIIKRSILDVAAVLDPPLEYVFTQIRFQNIIPLILCFENMWKLNRVIGFIVLTHLFQIHSFSTAWKHQKTIHRGVVKKSWFSF